MPSDKRALELVKGLNIRELRAQLRGRGMSPGGSEEELRMRLAEYMASTGNTTLLKYAPPGQQEAEDDSHLRNNYARPGGNQNLGNRISDRPSSRVLAPPGGKSQISFGDGPSPAPAPRPASKSAAASKGHMVDAADLYSRIHAMGDPTTDPLLSPLPTPAGPPAQPPIWSQSAAPPQYAPPPTASQYATQPGGPQYTTSTGAPQYSGAAPPPWGSAAPAPAAAPGWAPSAAPAPAAGASAGGAPSAIDLDALFRGLQLKDLRGQCRARGLNVGGGQDILTDRIKEDMRASGNYAIYPA